MNTTLTTLQAATIATAPVPTPNLTKIIAWKHGLCEKAYVTTFSRMALGSSFDAACLFTAKLFNSTPGCTDQGPTWVRNGVKSLLKRAYGIEE